MEINYIEKDGKKLFSFHRHDFQQFETGEFIDGGWDYTRSSGEVKSGRIRDLIKDIREQYTWGANYEKDGITLREETKWILLKDLETNHIIKILLYFVDKKPISNSLDLNTHRATQLIFLYELLLRDESAG